MRIVSWEEFDMCVKKIVDSSSAKSFCGVYGFPRGGLCLAVALSHSLNIPLLQEIKNGCLVVDDVYETGRTLNQILNTPNVTTFVWFSKIAPTWWNSVEITSPDEWLVFPWEDKDRAEEDITSYKFSRSEVK